jgi:magnesium transporter
VRTLYKHVINAMTSASDLGEQNKSPRRGSTEENKQPGLLDQRAAGSAIVNAGEVRHELVVSKPPTLAKPHHNRAQSFGLTAIKEGDINALNPLTQDSPEVTYRERLGGYLHPRDMRKLVTPFSASNEPEFIVRRHAMLLNFDPLRAIILRDRLLVLVPDGADSLLVELERRVRGAEKGLSEGMKHSVSMDFDNLSVTSNFSASKKKNDSSTAVASAIPSTIKELHSEGQQDDNTGMEIDHSQDSSMTTGMVADDVINILKSKRLDSNGASEASTDDLSVDVFNPMVDNEWEELEARGWIDLPFELQSVDAVLHSVSAILADEVLDLQLGANGIIEELLSPGADFGDHAQEMLRGMKNSVGEMTSRVKGFCRAIDMILEDYEDMTLMNLSRLLTHPGRLLLFPGWGLPMQKRPPSHPCVIPCVM